MSGMGPNDVAILSFPGATQEFIGEIHDVVDKAMKQRGHNGITLITAEEVKVIDLDKLEEQLKNVLSLVQQIQKAKRLEYEGEEAAYIEPAVMPRPPARAQVRPPYNAQNPLLAKPQGKRQMVLDEYNYLKERENYGQVSAYGSTTTSNTGGKTK